MRLPLVATLLLVIALVACGDEESESSASSEEGCEQVEAPAPTDVNLKPPRERLERGADVSATVATSCGEFEIALDTKRSPKTTSSFVHLAEEDLYEGTTFHRIVPGFVIQGGDPSGDGTGGPGYSVTEPPPRDTVYERGVVAMAKSSAEPPGTSGSQFFVVTAPGAADLPPDYAVLGEVAAGEEVVDRIAGLGDPATGEVGTPTQIVVIDSVTVEGA